MFPHAPAGLLTVALSVVIAPTTSWAVPQQRVSAKRVHTVHHRTAPAHNRARNARRVVHERAESASAPAALLAISPVLVLPALAQEATPLPSIAAAPVVAPRSRKAPVTKDAAVPRELELLPSAPTTSLMARSPAFSLEGDTFSDDAQVPVRSDRFTLVGVIEAPERQMMLVGIAVNGRIVHGRIGDVLDGRYRIAALTGERAELIDEATGESLGVEPPPVTVDAQEPAEAPAEASGEAPASTPTPTAMSTPTQVPTPTQMPTQMPTRTSTQFPRPSPTGTLRVLGEPAFAEIFVDGAYVGTVADMNEAPGGLPLEAGAHQLNLQAPDHQPVGLAVRITSNRTTTYRVALSKERP